MFLLLYAILLFFFKLFMTLLFHFYPPQHFLEYLHLCFSLCRSCCLSVMWSRTDAASPNCGTAISALLRLLWQPVWDGALWCTSLSGLASKKKQKTKKGGKKWQDWPSSFLLKVKGSMWTSPFSERGASHLQCSAAQRLTVSRGLCGGRRGAYLQQHKLEATGQCDRSPQRCCPPSFVFVMEKSVCTFCVITPMMKPTKCGWNSGLLAGCPGVGYR